MIRWTKLHLVAARDFWAIVQTKSFLIGLLSLVFIGSVMPGMLALGLFQHTYTIAVLDPTGVYTRELSERSRQQKNRLTFVDLTSSASRTEALTRVRQKEFYGLVEIAVQAPLVESFTISVITLGDRTPTAVLQGLLNQIVRERRAVQLGISVENLRALDSPIVIANQRVLQQGTEPAEQKDFVIAYLIPICLIFSLFGLISFQSERLLTALMEEKLKRLLEVLLTRVTIYELLLGKMLGILYVGFLLFAGVAVLVKLAAILFHFGDLLKFSHLFFYTLFYVSGYFLYANFYAAIGAACANPKDAENLSMPLRMLLMIPVMTSVYVTAQPQSFASVVFSYLPITAPFVMMNRLVLLETPWWEPALALAGILISGGVALWMATRIFRASFLAQSRTLTLRDMWRSLRG
jgi:ABC-2 type transport system permease protein